MADERVAVAVPVEPADDQDTESSGCSKDKSSGPQNIEFVLDNDGFDHDEGDRAGGASLPQIESLCTTEEAFELDEVDNTGKDDLENGPHDEEIKDPREREKLFLEIIETKKYQKVEVQLTAKKLMELGDNPLLLAIRVTEILHERASNSEQDKADFNDLASRVEEFTLRFLDPLKYDENLRKQFSTNPHTDVILETAVKLEQKKFFEHPIIIDLMSEKWYGGRRHLKASRPWWLFLNIWCLFDIFLFPLIMFGIIAKVLVEICTSDDEDDGEECPLAEKYFEYFGAPYFIFVRDMLSYLVLLGLHLAICLEPSQLPFSGLEWAILVFLLGRLMMELKQLFDLARAERKKERKRFQEEQITKGALRKYLRYNYRSVRKENQSTSLKALKNYLNDRWNHFDLLVLLIFFFMILPLRIFTWAASESVTNNRVLVVAGYLYGFNTMFLIVRVFGQILETIKGIGSIQIALFHIIRDAFVVIVHFIAITLAFSSTLTKVYVAESSMVEEDSPGETPVCLETGMECWWKITTHLGWALLELSEGLDLFKSADRTSDTLARLLFAAYLVMALILLINMLIALLSHTYQRVQFKYMNFHISTFIPSPQRDNAEKEWAYQKAITIQTYCDYHPIPVPINIISLLVMSCYCFREEKKIDWKVMEEQWLSGIVSGLRNTYRLKYGDSFPPTDRLDEVLQDTKNTESMVTQVLYRSFKKKQGSDEALLPTGQKAWEANRAIVIEDCLLTCHGYKYYPQDYKDVDSRCGARYRTAFSSQFPHFEVMILETGETKWLGLGVVFDDYGITLMPGWKRGTVGYHTDDRNIFDAEYAENDVYKKTTGSAAARRGDVIRCTVMFDSKQERDDGKVRVPVVFTANGSRIIPEGNEDTYIDYSPNQLLYPYVAFKYNNSVLAKMCAREGVDSSQRSPLQEVKDDLATLKDTTKSLEGVTRGLQDMTRGLEKKLDALLAKFDK